MLQWIENKLKGHTRHGDHSVDSTDLSKNKSGHVIKNSDKAKGYRAHRSKPFLISGQSGIGCSVFSLFWHGSGSIVAHPLVSDRPRLSFWLASDRYPESHMPSAVRQFTPTQDLQRELRRAFGCFGTGGLASLGSLDRASRSALALSADADPVWSW